MRIFHNSFLSVFLWLKLVKMCFCLTISRFRQNALSDFHVFVCKYIIYRTKIHSYRFFYFKFKPKKYNSSPTVSLKVSCFSRPVCGLTVNQIEKLLRTLRLEKLVFYNIIFYKFPDSLSVSSQNGRKLELC